MACVIRIHTPLIGLQEKRCEEKEMYTLKERLLLAFTKLLMCKFPNNTYALCWYEIVNMQLILSAQYVVSYRSILYMHRNTRKQSLSWLYGPHTKFKSGLFKLLTVYFLVCPLQRNKSQQSISFLKSLIGPTLGLFHDDIFTQIRLVFLTMSRVWTKTRCHLWNPSSEWERKGWTSE